MKTLMWSAPRAARSCTAARSAAGPATPHSPLPCPPGGLSPKPDTSSRGPATSPQATASRNSKSMPCASLMTRAVVTPLDSMPATLRTPLIACQTGGIRTWPCWSPSPGRIVMCVCASTKPGRITEDPKSCSVSADPRRSR